MGLIDDILKGLPVNPLLREQVKQLNAEKAASETENSILKDDLREANAEIARLKQQLDALQHHKLNELEVDILRRIMQSGPDNNFISVMFQQPRPTTEQLERLTYHAQRLQANGYIEGGYIDEDFGEQFSLTQKGREALIEKGLI